jgi:hypothetical protein
MQWRIFDYLGLGDPRQQGIGEDYIARSLSSVFVTKYHSGDQVKKTEMGRICSTNGVE